MQKLRIETDKKSAENSPKSVFSFDFPLKIIYFRYFPFRNLEKK